jgi:hypothetical protein
MAKRRVVDHALFAVLEQSGRSMIRHGTKCNTRDRDRVLDAGRLSRYCFGQVS